jgi:hypothetical protein
MSNITGLKGEDMDWTNGTVSFVRKKTGVPVIVHLGAEALNLFKDLPAVGKGQTIRVDTAAKKYVGRETADK